MFSAIHYSLYFVISADYFFIFRERRFVVNTTYFHIKIGVGREEIDLHPNIGLNEEF